jgi:hypothetical protein
VWTVRVHQPALCVHSDGAKFISACLLSLATLMRMDLPTVNVLSKIDLLSSSDGGLHLRKRVELLRKQFCHRR